MTDKTITLSIESGIQSGSLAILDGTQEIDFWVGTKTVSRSEELLQEISALLERNDLKKQDIELVAVSNSAGSYTGIRIGLATALGIRKAVGCRIEGVSVLEALTLLATESGKYISAVSANSRDVYSLKFNRLSSGEIILNDSDPDILSYADFRRLIFEEKPSGLFVNEGLSELLAADRTLPGESSAPVTGEIQMPERKFIVDAGKNLAQLIGVKARGQDSASDNVQQVYLREFK